MSHHGDSQQNRAPIVGRLRSLDGLRGVAALVVLVHHSLLVVPALAGGYFDQPPADGSAAWWLTYSPLHLLWEGREAVYVFFVLSGLVLTLPFLRTDRRPSWRSYYPQRVARLYLPVIAAVALGTAVAILSDRTPDSAASLWLQARPADPSPIGVVRDITLLGGTSDLISPLWSLQWEVVFSLLLPIYVAAALLWPRLFWVKMVGAVAVVAIGAIADITPAIYLPMFAVGALLAVRLEQLHDLGRRVSSPAWAAITVLALLLVTSRWLLQPFTDRAEELAPPAILVGATLLIVVAAFSPRARTLLETPAAQWLGRISFSLYLIHEPIVIALGYLVGDEWAWTVLPLALLICLPLAALFFRLIEAPAHDLAKRIGRRFAPVPAQV